MRNIINRETFISETTEAGYKGSVLEVGTVECTIGDETKRLPAVRSDEGRIYIRSGIGGKYRTSMKVWKASISTRDDGKPDYVWFGRDDRFNFRKQGIFFSNKV